MSHASRLRLLGTQTHRKLRVSYATGLGLVVALWIALGAFSTWDLKSERESERQQAATLANALAAHTTRLLREANQVADVVTWLVKREGVEVGLDNYVHSGLVDLDVFTQVAVIDKHGMLRASTFPGFEPIDHADRDYYRTHIYDRSTRLFISKPVIDRVSGEMSIQLSRRINDSQGRFIGVVVVSVPPALLTEMLESQHLGREGLIGIIGTEDYIIRARRAGEHHDTNWPIPARSPLRIALGHAPQGELEAVSPFDHIRRTISYRTLATYPLAVMVGFSNEEYLAAYRQRMLVLVVAGIVLTLLILSAAFYQGRLMRRLEAASLSEREAHERKTKEAERAEALFKAIPDAAVGFSAEGRIDGYNPHLLSLLGWAEDQVSTATPADIAEALFRDDVSAGSLDEIARFTALLSGSALHESTQSAMFRLDRTQPAVYEVRLERRGKNSAGVMALIRDVTREQANEEALVRSEARYRQLIELSPFAVFLIQDLTIAFANAKALAMLGAYSSAQIRGLPLVEFLHADSRATMETRMARLVHSQTATSAREAHWLRLDGSAFLGEMTAVPYETDGVPGALVILQDVTSRKEAETQRDRLFDLSLDLICLADPTGNFKRVNPAFSHVLGWSDEELMSRPFIDFVHPGDRAATVAEIARHGTGEPIEHFENRYICKDGSVRWLAWKAIQLDGLIYATARDVTESRHATRQLEQARADAEAASRAKSAFLAAMSHEIRTPMNGVIGMIEVLSQTGLTADQSDMVTTVRESAHALLTLIDDILDFSKIEAGRLHIERVPVSIGHLTTGLCQSLKPVAERAGVTLEKSIAADLPQAVLSDDTRLRQVLYNLVGNAIKFSGGRADKPGCVRVRVTVAPLAAGRVEVSIDIEDNGIGMSAETLPKLFKPFTQAEASTTRRFGGTGLGLAICRRLVDLMGGTISVRSTVGTGSTFTVRLPLDVDPNAVAVSRSAAQSGGDAREQARIAPVGPALSVAQAREQGRLILVAEDDAINQKVILRQLALLGHVAEIASDGCEALALWRAHRYALLLTDLHMPEMDGYELVETIRREEAPGTRLPIVALTANAVQGEATRAKAVGMDGYLTKPLQLNRLQAVLETHFRAPEASRAAVEAQPEPATRDAAPTTAVDLDVLKGIVGDDPEVVRELLADYQQSVGRLAAELRVHCDAGRGREAGAIAHKLKSSSRSVGAMALGDLCAELENAGKAGDLALLANWAKQFDTALAAVEDSLEQLLAIETK
ncbi:PAS domain S-box protein [Trinickia caryophylli]|uniref:Sensory/regulatory protein RpfC n=1 Tax=Trinickia caryophylli TaxID=28094 RepID=A0A1X7GY39_TRICW|nr:PAS domain S-box protein [Trinickia caryophylli]PMS10132.1 PAS domain S-box protein [Trinickia caryophylli]TRX18234.1 PAS domain S-box protein [Trinickia caryophylli]WQE10980.1 PAS domain S-box protein [Trinickia caryophylli]SMF76573.1 PAS domain S-box-containing protein [Trinickia caryophylli]GLU35408.1 hypothetical protein Busp01_52500 [Trinickia caryophylli]